MDKLDGKVRLLKDNELWAYATSSNHIDENCERARELIIVNTNMTISDIMERYKTRRMTGNITIMMPV